MKILFFLDHIGGGGRERRMTQLVLALDRIPDVQMMTVTATPKIDYTEVLDTKMEIKVVNDSSHFKRLKHYDSIIKEYKPDVIHLWTETSLYCVSLPFLSHKYGCKYVVGFVADGLPLTTYPFIQRQCIKFTFRKADAIVSNSMAGLVAKKAPAKSSHVIYNGFDKGRLVNIEKTSKRLELGINSSKLVTMCARVNHTKDWGLFIALATRFVGKDVFFLAVGGGEQLEYYQKEVKDKQLNNISFIGRRSDIMEIIAASDICALFTNASEHAEGVSNSIMESMAAGVPVVATDGGGTPEIITNEVDGYIIESGDVDKAVQNVDRLLKDDDYRIYMGQKARETIKSRFDLKTKGDEYLALYKQLIG